MNVENKIIEPKILSTKFACDTSACKGACCTFPGGDGPPVLPEELEHICSSYSVVEKYLPDDHRRVISRAGLLEHRDGRYTIRCFNHRACVFVMYAGDIAVCSLQYAHSRGEIAFIKPLSCHLFPIRIRGKEGELLMFERFSECEPAEEFGERQDISVVEFLQDALVRAFGKDFFHQLADASKRSLQGNS